MPPYRGGRGGGAAGGVLSRGVVQQDTQMGEVLEDIVAGTKDLAGTLGMQENRLVSSEQAQEMVLYRRSLAVCHGVCTGSKTRELRLFVARASSTHLEINHGMLAQFILRDASGSVESRLFCEPLTTKLIVQNTETKRQRPGQGGTRAAGGAGAAAGCSECQAGNQGKRFQQQEKLTTISVKSPSTGFVLGTACSSISSFCNGTRSKSTVPSENDGAFLSLA